VFAVGVVRVKILTKVGLARVVVLPLVDRLALSSKRSAVAALVRLAVQVFVVGVVRVKILTNVGLARVVVLPLVDRLALLSKSAVVAALASVVWRRVIERYAIVVMLVIVVAVQLFIGVRSI
jgi:hypothetical protein